MSKSLPPAIRRQIIAFDPAAPDAPSVSEFCRAVGISRPSFYNLRERYAAEGNAALNPRSRAPKTPAVKGHENLPSGGQETCPVAVTSFARWWPWVLHGVATTVSG